MKFLIGLVVGAIIAAAIGAAAFSQVDDFAFVRGGHDHDEDKSEHVSRTFDLTDFDSSCGSEIQPQLESKSSKALNFLLTFL